jgi:two-component sensor histidine kinase
VLEVASDAPREFDALDISLIVSIAGLCSDAVERFRRQTRLESEHEARGLLLREHHHRMRNHFHVILGALQRHAREATTDNSRQRFNEIARRVFALAELYDHLVGFDLGDRIEFGHYLEQLCRSFVAFYDLNARGIAISCTRGNADIVMDIEAATSFGMVVNELVANAIEHAFDPSGGIVDIMLHQSSSRSVCLVVDDSGKGMDATLAESSVGLRVARRLVERIGGTITARPRGGGGTRWVIELPPVTKGSSSRPGLG